MSTRNYAVGTVSRWYCCRWLCHVRDAVVGKNDFPDFAVFDPYTVVDECGVDECPYS